MKMTVRFSEIILIGSMFFWPTLVAISGIKFDHWYITTMIAASIWVGIGIGKKELP